MAKKKKSGISRRKLLKGAAATVGAAAGSGAITGFPTIWAQNIKDVELVYVGQAFSTIPDIAKKAKEDLGFTVTMQTVDAVTMTNRLLTQPNSLDLVDMGNTSLKYVFGRDVVQAIPAKQYKWWDQTVPLFTKGTYPDGTAYSMQGYAPIKSQYYTSADANKYSPTPTEWLVGVPLYYNADTLGVRPDLTGRPVTSWADLLSPDFKGKAALEDGAPVGATDSAMALEAAGDVKYVDKGNMTRDEIDKTIAKLIEYKKAGQFRAFWTNFDQAVELMASGEVVIQSMIAPAVTAVRSRDIACVDQPLKEGYRGWYIMLVYMKHLSGLKLDCAMEYANWFNSGWAGAFISRQGFYNSIPENVQKFLTPDEYGYWYEGKPSQGPILNPYGRVMEKAGIVRDGGSLWQRMGHIAMWNSLMDQDRYLTSKWNEFLTA